MMFYKRCLESLSIYVSRFIDGYPAEMERQSRAIMIIGSLLTEHAMHREGTRWKRWHVVAISTLAVGVTPFLFTLGCIYIDMLVSSWPHWPGVPSEMGDMALFAIFTLIITIPCGLLLSLIAQRAFHMFYPMFFLYLCGMLIVAFIGIILASLLLPVRMHHEDDLNWAAALIGISTLTGALTTYWLNTRFSLLPEPAGPEASFSSPDKE